MKKLKIPIITFMLLGSFGATVVMPNIAHAKEISAQKKMPRWLWKLIVRYIVYQVLEDMLNNLAVAPVGSTGQSNIDMNALLQDVACRDGLVQEGVIVADDQITFTNNVPAYNYNDGTGLMVQGGTYHIDQSGMCLLRFVKVLVPSPTFPEDEPKLDQ